MISSTLIETLLMDSSKTRPPSQWHCQEPSIETKTHNSLTKLNIQGVSKNLLEFGAHKTFFWIQFLDVQGVGKYLFIDFLFLIVQDFYS